MRSRMAWSPFGAKAGRPGVPSLPGLLREVADTSSVQDRRVRESGSDGALWKPGAPAAMRGSLVRLLRK